ncbi:MAG: hypothetical protein LBO66_13935 [Deltaproteobacteria bacterium]|jgi:hypothetical protein|nr:hypothetical protein [Deltaproteobacteria bacterium]
MKPRTLTATLATLALLAVAVLLFLDSRLRDEAVDSASLALDRLLGQGRWSFAKASFAPLARELTFTDFSFFPPGTLSWDGADPPPSPTRDGFLPAPLYAKPFRASSLVIRAPLTPRALAETARRADWRAGKETELAQSVLLRDIRGTIAFQGREATVRLDSLAVALLRLEAPLADGDPGPLGFWRRLAAASLKAEGFSARSGDQSLTIDSVAIDAPKAFGGPGENAPDFPGAVASLVSPRSALAGVRYARKDFTLTVQASLSAGPWQFGAPEPAARAASAETLNGLTLEALPPPAPDAAGDDGAPAPARVLITARALDLKGIVGARALASLASLAREAQTAPEAWPLASLFQPRESFLSVALEDAELSRGDSVLARVARVAMEGPYEAGTVPPEAKIAFRDAWVALPQSPALYLGPLSQAALGLGLDPRAPSLAPDAPPRDPKGALSSPPLYSFPQGELATQYDPARRILTVARLSLAWERWGTLEVSLALGEVTPAFWGALQNIPLLYPRSYPRAPVGGLALLFAEIAYRDEGGLSRFAAALRALPEIPAASPRRLWSERSSLYAFAKLNPYLANAPALVAAYQSFLDSPQSLKLTLRPEEPWLLSRFYAEAVEPFSWKNGVPPLDALQSLLRSLNGEIAANGQDGVPFRVRDAPVAFDNDVNPTEWRYDGLGDLE